MSRWQPAYKSRPDAISEGGCVWCCRNAITISVQVDESFGHWRQIAPRDWVPCRATELETWPRQNRTSRRIWILGDSWGSTIILPLPAYLCPLTLPTSDAYCAIRLYQGLRPDSTAVVDVILGVEVKECLWCLCPTLPPLRMRSAADRLSC